uniref:Ubiquitin-conjugating enzyme E2 Z n=1 Tax=viral metagenome TaxID=1070528 RepID=A0A6C0CYC5_9ZZZZ
MNKVIKRLTKIDMRKIDDLKNSGIYLEFDENNVLNARAIIFGPEETIYTGSILYFDINFPLDYPFSPLKIKYISNGNNIRIHPNIYTCGKVCLSILGTWPGPQWTSIMDVSCVLLSIKSLLDNNPLYNEPGFTPKNIEHTKISKNYNDIIQHNCIYRLYNKNSKNIPENFKIFEPIINKHFKDNNNYINSVIEKNKNIKKRIEIPLYRISDYIEYNRL